MGTRTGVVNLPLHGGKAPRWLFNRMVNLAGEITEVLIYEYGQDEFLRRISDPYWFQAFGCVLGFDWHSSGVTTTACGALKVAIDPEKHGIKIAGGKGKTSRKTLDEIEETSSIFSLSTQKTDELIYSSRMSAKVDNTCVQDGYQLYHHCFIFTEDGKWAVVQQGMNAGKTRNSDERQDISFGSSHYARRYHWLSDQVKNLVEEPHTGICCDRKEKETLDMTAKESEEARKISVDLVKDNPLHLEKYFKPTEQRKLMDFKPEFTMPEHHPVLDIDIGKAGMKVLQRAYEIQPQNYEELISLRGMGPKKIRALTLISDLVYGTKSSWEDPVKYSFTHGGKDGYPYPVNRKVYDHSIHVLKDAVEQAKLNDKDRYYAIKRLKDFIV